MTEIDRSYHERKIKNAVGFFFVGCIAFIILEFWLIYLGVIKITHPESDWPSSFVVLGLGGLYLLWEMLVAIFFKTPLPEHYRLIEQNDYPRLFAIIHEITSKLNIALPHAVYVTSGLNAAVFCRPTMLSMLVKPRKELVIGEILLDVLTTEELRIVLYHEFGHYSSNSLGKKTPICIISQFSKSFISVKKMKKAGVWSNLINSQVALFSYFAFWLCSIIDCHYKPLAQDEELAADKVAVDNMGPETLVITLVKVSLLQHYYHYVKWVENKTNLHFQRVDLSKILLLLYLNHKGGTKSIPSAIRLRIERHMVDRKSIHIPNNVTSQPAALNSTLTYLLDIHQKYEKARLRSKSVVLTFHLDRKKHKLPWVEGKYQILLDGKPIGNGNFIKGFEFSVRTSPGKHVVSVYGISGIIAVPHKFECKSGDCHFFNMDFKVHLRNGYYEIFVASSKVILKKDDRFKDTGMLI